MMHYLYSWVLDVYYEQREEYGGHPAFWLLLLWALIAHPIGYLLTVSMIIGGMVVAIKVNL